MNVFIYYLSDMNNNIRYIGKTKNPLRKRLYKHIQESKKNISYKNNWINYLLSKCERPIIKVIDEVPENDWEFWEQYWISQFKCWGFKLTNLTEGGGGGNGYKHSEESIKKMSQSKIGLKLSDEHKQKISQSLLDKSLDPNYVKFQPRVWIFQKDDLYQNYIVENLSIPKLSKHYSCSEKTIFTNLKEYGILKDQEIWIEQCVSNPRKIVLQYNLSGELIKEWDSLKSASKFYKSTNIANCCRGEVVTACDFIWRYKDEFKEVDLDRLNYKKRKVSQYDLEGNLIRSFDSIKEAASFGFNEGNIQDCCVGRLKSSKGFIWRYFEDPPPQKYKNKTIKKVIQFSYTGEFIKEWDSIVDVTKELKIGGNSIVTCCKGKYKTAGGFIWKYKNNI